MIQMNRLQIHRLCHWNISIVFMKTLTSPINAGSSIGAGSMKKAIMGTNMPLEKMPFWGFFMPHALRAVIDFGHCFGFRASDFEFLTKKKQGFV
jgi:hypothetical protein